MSVDIKNAILPLVNSIEKKPQIPNSLFRATKERLL